MSEIIKKYDFKEGLPQGFEILDFRYLYNDFYDEMIKPNKAEFYYILWFQKAGTTHWIDFNVFDIDEENTLLFVNKNSVQRFGKNKNIKGKVILFTDDFFCKTKNDVNYLKTNILFNDLQSNFKVKVDNTKYTFLQIFNQLESEFSLTKDNFQSDILKNNLFNFLLNAEREKRNQDFIKLEKNQNLNYTLQFKELLELNFIDKKQVSFYCDKLSITPKKLNISTSNVLGKSPKDIITERVLLEAKRLLIHTTNTSKEISYMLGFEESTNFIKFFKKHQKHTPLQFRENFN